MSKKNKKQKRTHINRYASHSHAEEEFKKKLAQEKKASEQSSYTHLSTHSTPSYSTSRPTTLLSQKSPMSSRQGLESSLSRAPEQPADNEVIEYGSWWLCKGLKFQMCLESDPNTGFAKEEVPKIAPQLTRFAASPVVREFALVNSNNQSFYVVVEKRGYVQLPYAETRDREGIEYYGCRRTNKPEEIPSFRR
ncbi:MAG: hypothetical protein Q8N99_02260 [Nanoarchaeota archaeon]|nr:hypothetical protein [Nanoarchaeota archaeon]